VPCQTGFATLSGLYARVASTVEQAARQQGYAVDLGSQRAAAVASTSSTSGAMGSGSAASGRGGRSPEYGILQMRRLQRSAACACTCLCY
jgi:ADP-ribosylation factor GTPase-activating protein 1